MLEIVLMKSDQRALSHSKYIKYNYLQVTMGTNAAVSIPSTSAPARDDVLGIVIAVYAAGG